MTTNSLAFRLFATAAAWTLLVLPSPAHHLLAVRAARRDQLRRAADRLSPSCCPTLGPRRQEPRVPKNIGEPLFEVTHSGWYWQITPLDGRPGRRWCRARSPTCRYPAEREQGRAQHRLVRCHLRARWSSPCASPRPSTRGEARWRSAIRCPSPARGVDTTCATSARGWPSPWLGGLGLVAAHAVPGALRSVAAAKVEKGLTAIRSGDATRLEGDLPQEIEPLQRSSTRF